LDGFLATIMHHDRRRMIRYAKSIENYQKNNRNDQKSIAAGKCKAVVDRPSFFDHHRHNDGIGCVALDDDDEDDSGEQQQQQPDDEGSRRRRTTRTTTSDYCR
jgi:hypothetical protein